MFARQQNRGLGLGLAIVKRLGELLGHAVDVRSREGRGSVFVIDVPLAPAGVKVVSREVERAGTEAPARSGRFWLSRMMLACAMRLNFCCVMRATSRC